jgi:CDP-paratose 2-epimerase
MAIVISGICGFVGSSLARWLLESNPRQIIFGFDNFSRPGSHVNRSILKDLGVNVIYGDVRQQSDVDSLPKADWVIDAAANPAVLAGVDGKSTMRQVIENNLQGTVNLLEYARRHEAGFILLSSSRVYSIRELQSIPLRKDKDAFAFDDAAAAPAHVTSQGISELFSTTNPISLYGSTKLCSEILAQEYGSIGNLPVWINRCGVLAGAGQFGRPDQGIFSYWVNSYLTKQPLAYIGYGGEGHQVRDCLHPKDLAVLVEKQMNAKPGHCTQVTNLGGGANNAMSLRQLSHWCQDRFGRHEVKSVIENRPADAPWIVMDNKLAEQNWGFKPSVPLPEILEEITVHAKQHPDWLQVSSP